MANLLLECENCHCVTAHPICPECGTVVVMEKPVMKKMIQKMPEIWDDARFPTSRNAVLGQLAQCAVRQTPYLVPTDLGLAIEEMAYAISGFEEYFYTSCQSLHELIRRSFDECPAIQAWNVPKKGNHQMVFVSRFETPDPDYDFIDLDALARNVAHGITLQEKYDGLHD